MAERIWEILLKLDFGQPVSSINYISIHDFTYYSQNGNSVQKVLC